MTSKAKLSKYALLRHKKYRDKEGLFLIQGTKAVADASPYYEVVDRIVDPDEIRKISTLDNLPEIVAVCRIPETESRLKADRESFSLVLDGVQDPGNLGTIIRTAHWFGIRKIYCSRTTVDVYNPKVVMATMGSIAKVKVVYCDLTELFDSNANIPVYGLLLEGENIFTAKNLEPGFIVMGSEGHGLMNTTESRITKALTIPAANPVERPDSLNVAIATAITLSVLDPVKTIS